MPPVLQHRLIFIILSLKEKIKNMYSYKRVLHDQVRFSEDENLTKENIYHWMLLAFEFYKLSIFIACIYNFLIFLINVKYLKR